MTTKAERAIASARKHVDAEVLRANVIVPRSNVRQAMKWTSMAAGIDGRLTRLLNSMCSNWTCRERDVFQFGVFTGTGARKIGAHIQHFGHLWGFDSFRGIPEEPDDTEQRAWKGKGNLVNKFRAGQYSAADAMGVFNLSELIGYVAQRVDRPNTTFVPGYFSESLTDALMRRYTFQPALLVDVDVDIYMSTVQCLDWMLSHQLLIPSSFVRYDDWPAATADDGEAAGTLFYGQARAHYEISRRHRVKWRHVARNALMAISIGERHCAPELCSPARFPPMNSNASKGPMVVLPPLRLGLPVLVPDG